MEGLQQRRLTDGIRDAVDSWLLNNHPANREWDPAMDARPESCTSTNGLECTHPEHDHRAVDGDSDSPEMLCDHCRCPLFWDERSKRYWHTDPSVPACFLVAARS
jgi:hypothetical protein